MSGFLKVILSDLDDKNKQILDKAGSLWEKICDFFAFRVWAIIRDYRFILFGVLVILIIFIIVGWAKKHVPSRGRITDIYDVTGERKNKKKRKTDEIHDLPEEFYRKK